MERFLGLLLIYAGIMVFALIAGAFQAILSPKFMGPFETYGGVICMVMMLALFPIAAASAVYAGVNMLRKRR